VRDLKKLAVVHQYLFSKKLINLLKNPPKKEPDYLGDFGRNNSFKLYNKPFKNSL